ncbi:MAG: hypothetical protein [Satomivirus wayo]|uniref:Uncharacterized protein n=1 Tax=Bacteriophage sp. TaxID=38018 RepID=A0ABY5T363_9VIRU|nr:MAG: hypothetical protein [Bacteriophage sp.]UVY14728.1 MAG: hypothetical protein [Bacteriophage sp.]
MTQKEFEERTGLTPNSDDFSFIHSLYMNTSMEKDQFCKEYKKIAGSEIVKDVHARLINSQIILEQRKQDDIDMARSLIGKSRAYDDTDFRNMAIKLIGEKDVVCLTMEMDLPLWSEDKEFIKSHL